MYLRECTRFGTYFCLFVMKCILLFYFQTVFELNPTQKSIQNQVMKNKRREHGEIIEKFLKAQEQDDKDSQIIASDKVRIRLTFRNV